MNCVPVINPRKRGELRVGDIVERTGDSTQIRVGEQYKVTKATPESCYTDSWRICVQGSDYEFLSENFKLITPVNE